MPLQRRHVGQRVVVRRLLPGQQGPSGGPAMTDVTGILETWDEGSFAVRREDGDLVTIERDLFVTGKPIPPRASTRLRVNPERLERICEGGWQPIEAQPLGEWTLRAAGGFTGRANSARVGGDPGVATDAALETVADFYTARGLPVLAQVVVGSDWQTAFVERGWVTARHAGQDPVVQVASVARTHRRAGERASRNTDSLPARLDSTPSPDWLALYGRTAGIDATVVRRVMESGDEVAFARIGDPVLAIGRGVVTGHWLGLQAVEVVSSRRRQGLATAVVDTLLAWGASHGALSAYLQVLPDNDAALALYAGYGFTTHHAYRYLTPST
ncbi:MAG TPA: GNAT family N-acetyltransferase [Nocardioidaceae bacterium]